MSGSPVGTGRPLPWPKASSDAGRVSMSNVEAVNLLKRLIGLSEDGEKGFTEVAAEATSPELKDLFKQRSDDCATAATELHVLMQSLGGTPDAANAASGTPVDDRSRPPTSGGDGNLQALMKVESAESHAATVYAEALASGLPHQVREVLLHQHRSAVSSHSHIHNLRISYRTADPA